MATSEAAWHMHRRQRILSRTPEVRRLFGPDGRTALWVLVVVALQMGLAAGVSRRSWVEVLVLAAFVGAFASHALGVLIHECSHDLVFKKPWANKALAIFANVPLAAPAAIEFRVQHRLHHQHLGDADGKDTQAPTRTEARVVQGGAMAKLLSFTFGRFFYEGRPANKVPVDRWIVANAFVVVGAMAILLAAAGVKAVVYLAVSALLAFGPHPTGARRLSEHLAVRPDQPTLSYYGPLNALSFDVGYHVEHHDFPLVPWTRIRALHGAARDEYEGLLAIQSWSALLARHVFDARFRVDHYVGMGAYVGAAAAGVASPAGPRADRTRGASRAAGEVGET